MVIKADGSFVSLSYTLTLSCKSVIECFASILEEKKNECQDYWFRPLSFSLYFCFDLFPIFIVLLHAMFKRYLAD